MATGGFGQPFAEGQVPVGQTFAMRVDRSGDAVWLALGGELDVFATPQLRSALRDVEQSGANLIVFDLRGLEFLDSSGLAVLLGAHERATSDANRAVKLVIQGSRNVESLFETLRAGEFLDIAEDPATLAAAGE